MKKTLAILLSAILAVSLLTACAGAKMDSATTSPAGGSMSAGFEGEMDYADGAAAPSSAPMPAPDMEMYDKEYGAAQNDAAYETTQPIAGTPDIQKTAAELSEKIIYTVSADIETVEFDDTIDKVYAMLDGFGAFIENSYVGGRNYWQTANSYQTYRSAWFTLRVPVAAVTAITDSLSDLGSVTGVHRSAENITSQFIDTESRLKAYRTQEERLLEMMEKAETVEDMLTIEGYLTDIRYQIESMTTQLQNWQSRVDYSTLTLNINEVEKYSELPPDLPQTYWQQVQSGFAKTLRGIGGFFTGLFKWLLVSSPVLILLAVICIVIVVVYVKRRRTARHKTDEAPPEDRR